MIDTKRCILIVDDEKKMLRVLKDFFTINDFYVLEAGDGEEAVNIFYENNAKIDLVLLDVMMPKLDGFQVLSEIRDASLVPVIMLTAKGEEYDQLLGFNSGADDYIQKPFSPSLLLARVEAVLKRIGKDKFSEITIGELTVNIEKRNVKVNGKRMELTPKEFDLLYYFILNKGLTLTREQILDSVWGYEFSGDTRTVDTHVKQLRSKLSEYSSYIKTIHRVGYQFEVEHEEN